MVGSFFQVLAVIFLVSHVYGSSTLRVPSVLKRTISIAAGVGLGLSSFIILPPGDDAPTSFTAHADSTGKFSSKLTAKKRYLPRVISGALEFKKVYKDPIKLDNFYKDDFKGLLRAMDLYGASLRRGEVPDEISRQTTTLTNEFEAKVNKFIITSDSAAKSKLAAESLQSLENYLEFAKISLE